jgi:hypothetical protein
MRSPAVTLALLVGLSLVAGPAGAQRRRSPRPERPDTAAIRRLATDLAADSMRGRGPWTPEATHAAQRLARELTKLGAHPLIGTSLLVPFTDRTRPNDTVYNVVGLIPSRPDSPDSTLVGITAHLDHLGVGTPDATGDSIYNGFLDDALGTAMVVDVARRYARHPGRRGLVVMFFNLEEQGLLGSTALVADPQTLPLLRRLTLVVGVDAGSPAGEALDWELMGGSPTHPAAQLADSLARTHGWTTRATPPRGISDLFVFSRVGIPILFPIPGSHWRGYTTARRDAAMAAFDHYHLPSDQPSRAFPLVGTSHFADWLWEIVQGSTNTPPEGH